MLRGAARIINPFKGQKNDENQETAKIYHSFGIVFFWVFSFFERGANGKKASTNQLRAVKWNYQQMTLFSACNSSFEQREMYEEGEGDIDGG